MHPRSLAKRLRKPSPAMIVAIGALFLSAGGASYAAVAIPNNSITNGMLKNNSVGFAKMRANAIGYQQIKPGSVGDARIDKQEVQESIHGTCTGGSQAITAVQETGTVTCGPTLPAEFSSEAGSNVALTSPTVQTPIQSYALTGGNSYIVQADPYIEVTPEATGTDVEHVVVSCTLAAGPSSSAVQTREATLDVTQGGSSEFASIPLTVTAPSDPNSETADVTCTSTPTDVTTPATAVHPTVDAQTQIYALQTASNTTATTTTPSVKH